MPIRAVELLLKEGRGGYGTTMLDHVLDVAREHGRARKVASVRRVALVGSL